MAAVGITVLKLLVPVVESACVMTRGPTGRPHDRRQLARLGLTDCRQRQAITAVGEHHVMDWYWSGLPTLRHDMSHALSPLRKIPDRQQATRTDSPMSLMSVFFFPRAPTSTLSMLHSKTLPFPDEDDDTVDPVPPSPASEGESRGFSLAAWPFCLAACWRSTLWPAMTTLSPRRRGEGLTNPGDSPTRLPVNMQAEPLIP